jgi:hypothetical protein
MSLALTIAIQRHHKVGDWFLAYDRISVDGCREYLTSIEKLNPRPFPENFIFDWYEDEGLKRRTVDSYGDKLTYLTAGELAKFFLAEENKGTTQRNIAFGKYLEALPEHYWCVLWWH